MYLLHWNLCPKHNWFHTAHLIQIHHWYLLSPPLSCRCQEENSAHAAYCTGSVVYMCNSTEIKSIGGAIFAFVFHLLINFYVFCYHIVAFCFSHLQKDLGPFHDFFFKKLLWQHIKVPYQLFSYPHQNMSIFEIMNHILWYNFSGLKFNGESDNSAKIQKKPML